MLMASQGHIVWYEMGLSTSFSFQVIRLSKDSTCTKRLTCSERGCHRFNHGYKQAAVQGSALGSCKRKEQGTTKRMRCLLVPPPTVSSIRISRCSRRA